MKYLYLSAFLLFFTSSVLAQSNFKPGYIVTGKNDTVKGFVDYKGWENNPKEFAFKTDLNQRNVKNYTVDDVAAFGITGIEHYRKFIFLKSMGSTNIDKLQIGIDTSRVLDTAFLKVIAKGKNVALLSFTDKIKTRFYIIDSKNPQLQELDYYVYYFKESEISYHTQNNYKSQLRDVANENNFISPKLTRAITYSQYKEKDIKEVITLINGNPAADAEMSDEPSVRYFVGAAARFSRLEAGGGFLPDGTKASQTQPVFSVGVDFSLNKNTQRFIFRAEAGFNAAHYSSPPEATDGNGTTGSLDFKQNTLSFMPQIIYNFYSKEKFKAFINGGISLNFSSYNKYYYLQNYNGISESKTYGFPDLAKYSNVFFVKAGVAINNKIAIYAAKGFTSPLSSGDGFYVNTSYYDIGLNYLF
jgi:hypothetical protein